MNELNRCIGGKDLVFAAKLREALEKERGNGTAMSVAIVCDGELLASAACGTQDGNPEHPATVDDLYNVGSISKVYCAIAVLKLCEMGKVDLDTPVVSYLPHFSMADERYKKITLRMCLNHSAALPGTMGAIFAVHPIDGKEHSKRFFRYISRANLTSDPGRYTVYCNDGFELAAEAVAAVSGMTYGEFLRKYITAPLHCPSTCTQEEYPADRVHIAVRGITEHVTAQGAGGLATDLSDCAKFGWAFVEPGVAFGAESAALTMTAQHLGFDERDADSTNYGLGWDGVNFRGIGVDLGEGTLIKGGGTPNFYSHLIVSPKHRFSAAISQTGDVAGSAAANLCRLIALLPDIPVLDEKVDDTPQAVPQKMAEALTGRYYGCSNHYDVSFDNSRLTVRLRTTKGWAEMVKDAVYNGEVFYDSPSGISFSFLCREDTTYLRCNARPEICMAIGAKKDLALRSNKAWCGRDGKKYLLKDGKAWDELLMETAVSVEIEAKEDTGFVSTITRGRADSVNNVVVTTLAAHGDDRTRAILPEGPYLSRDTYPIFAWEEDGVAHLCKDGFTYVDADSVPTLQQGCICTGEGDTCLAYRIERGASFSLSVTDARIILLDTDLSILFDSMFDGIPESVGEGFMLLLAERNARVDVRNGMSRTPA